MSLSSCRGFPQTPGSGLSPVREGEEAGGGAEDAVEDLAQEGLRLHNEYRRQHGVPPLQLSAPLCDYARQWAATLAREDRFGHRPDGRYGENIFCAWSPDAVTKVGAREACQTWYKEIKEHPFGQEPRLLKSGELPSARCCIHEQCEYSPVSSRLSSAGRPLLADGVEGQQGAWHGRGSEQKRPHHHRGQLPPARQLHRSVRRECSQTDGRTSRFLAADISTAKLT